jgi:M6 family metalloprotease-like protein
MRLWKHDVVKWTCVAIGLALSCMAAPFAEKIGFVQPDGTAIELWGEGDDFHAVFETLDGYTVTFDPVLKTYFYASVSADGAQLVATGLEVGKGNPATLGLPKHLRITAEARRLQARSRQEKWDLDTAVSQKWSALKALRRIAEAQQLDGPVMAPPTFTTTGQKMGLCLLIDFDDDPASVPQSSIVDFCNGDNYTGYGNNGSVKKYFQDNSNGLLVYSNTVTMYIRIPNSLHPKSWYNDTSKDAGVQANYLIRDALTIMKAKANYETEILPLFNGLTVDGGNRVVACNVFYAGGNGGAWANGLWPHSWSLYAVGAQELSSGGMEIFDYQVTNIGESLTIGTFCHENGHMLCGYPDIYDYDYDSVGGAGLFCLMNSGGHGTNPAQICAYLKYASGWSTTVELTYQSAVVANSVATPYADGYNRFYRYAKPGTETEYYLFENRQKVGRDANIPASGIAIWHIDELGDRDNQSIEYNTTHANYECTLMQADNQWHFQRYVNSGDVNDLFYQGNTAATYTGEFNDNTKPSAMWWDGTKSKLEVSAFSVNGAAMTYNIGPRAPVMLISGALPSGRVGTPYSFTVGAAGGVKPYVWTMIDGTLPGGIGFDGDGTVSGMPEEATTTQFTLVVTGDNGLAATNQFSLMIKPVFTAPFVETFENGGLIPDGWSQEYVQGGVRWSFRTGSPQGHPAVAYSNQYNAYFGIVDPTQTVTRLVSPRIDFGTDVHAAQLTFWHYMEPWLGDQDELSVYYKTAVDAEWLPVQNFMTPVGSWTLRTLTLPEPSRTYYVAFEGKAKYGYGICIDQVKIWDPTPPLGITTESPLPFAVTEVPYSLTLTAEGGTPPYTFSRVSGDLPDGFELSADGVISGLSSNVQTSTFTIELTDSVLETVIKTFSLDVSLPRADLFAEDFEPLYGDIYTPFTRRGWTQEFVTNAISWEFRVGAPFGNPSTSFSGNYNACLFSSAWSNGGSFDQKTKLISPNIDLGQAPANIKLTFWHYMEDWDGGQDELRVYYRTATNSPWVLLPAATYVTRVSSWTQRSLLLPSPTRTYQIAFEGNALFGYGVCIDDVRITDATDAPIITTGLTLPGGVIGVAYTTTLAASGGVEPYTWAILSNTLPLGLTLDSATGVISGTPVASGQSSFQVRVTGLDGKNTTNLCTLRITTARPMPFVETFENGGSIPVGWVQESVIGTLSWVFRSGSPVSPGVPTSAHSNSLYNACLYYANRSGGSARLISPMLNVGTGTNAQARLTFWHCMASYLGDQDQLKVLYKTTATSAWVEVASYKLSVPAWTERTIDLPNPSPTYYIAFEGLAKYGYGVCIDNVSVTGTSTASPYELWKTDVFGGDAGNEAISGDEADPDGDGIANALEYAMGLDPMVFDTEGLPFGGVTAGYLTLSFRMDKDAYDAGVVYEVEASTNLVEGFWTTVDVSEQSLADSNTWWQAIYQHDVPVTLAPRRFLRLKVTLP